MRREQGVGRACTVVFAVLALGPLPGCSGEGASVFSPVHLLSDPTARVVPFSVAEFRDHRSCWVYLPPGYASDGQRYPVLYMLDGQDVFGPTRPNRPSWGLESICDSLIITGALQPIIIVAIKNAGGDRLYEYTPFPNKYHPEDHEGGGRDFLRVLFSELKPAIDAAFLTQPGPDQTLLAGASLGGLMAMYAGFAYADQVTRIGSFGAPYSWDQGTFQEFVRNSPKPPSLRVYLDAGTIDDNTNSLLFMKDILIDKGFVDGVDMMGTVEEGGAHSPTSWSRRFPKMIKFLRDP